MWAAILTCGLVLTSCSSDDDPVVPPTDEVDAQLQQMTLPSHYQYLIYNGCAHNG